MTPERCARAVLAEVRTSWRAQAATAIPASRCEPTDGAVVVTRMSRAVQRTPAPTQSPTPARMEAVRPEAPQMQERAEAPAKPAVQATPAEAPACLVVLVPALPAAASVSPAAPAPELPILVWASLRVPHRRLRRQVYVSPAGTSDSLRAPAEGSTSSVAAAIAASPECPASRTRACPAEV